jgi:hypothetical protein
VINRSHAGSVARVDVADAGDRARVHQDVLDRFLPAAGRGAAGGRRESLLERLGTEVAQARVRLETAALHEVDESEAPRVRETQLASVVEREDHVLVRAPRPIGVGDPELPGHPEVHQERHPRVGLHQEVLASPLHRGDARPADPAERAPPDRDAQARFPHLHRQDAAAEQERSEAPAHRFHLRQLGHAGSVREA